MTVDQAQVSLESVANAASPSPVRRPRELPSHRHSPNRSPVTTRPARERFGGIRARPPPGKSQQAGDLGLARSRSAPDGLKGIVVRRPDALWLQVVRLRPLGLELRRGQGRNEAGARPDASRRRPSNARRRQCLQCIRKRRCELQGLGGSRLYEDRAATRRPRSTCRLRHRRGRPAPCHHQWQLDRSPHPLQVPVVRLQRRRDRLRRRPAGNPSDLFAD